MKGQAVNPDPNVLAGMLAEARRAPGIGALAIFAALCAAYAREAQAEIDRRLGFAQPPAPPAAAPGEDRWLTPKEAAPLLGTSVRSLSRRWRQLPFCRPPITGRGFRVSLTALREYMTARDGGDPIATPRPPAAVPKSHSAAGQGRPPNSPQGRASAALLRRGKRA